MRQTTKMNAIRSGIVVVGTLAFGYLTLELGFKPFLEKARDALDKSDPSPDPDHQLVDAAHALPNSSWDEEFSNRD